jgi:environmental stress-induced protein Ves
LIKIIRAAACRTMPWKNGAGSTTEIAIAPAGAGLDQFDWRVSRAEIAVDGPFSMFPGIDRTLALLEGDGVQLTIDGLATELTLSSPPFSFTGDGAAVAVLRNGPVEDLNVMTRRGRCRHRLRRFASTERFEFEGGGTTSLIYCQRGSAVIETPLGNFELDAEDSLLSEHSPPVRWMVRTHGRSIHFGVEFW